MAGVLAPDGSERVTIASGSIPVGAYASDGSLNITLSGGAFTPLNQNINYSTATQKISSLGSLTGGSGFTPGTSILAFGSITAGSGYTPGTYSNVALTDNTTVSATGATVNIIVSIAGTVVSCSINNAGAFAAGYLQGDVCTVSNTLIGGTGTGFTIPITVTGSSYTNVPLTGGSGTGAAATISIHSAQTAISFVTLTARGANYQVGDVLSINDPSPGGTGTGMSIPVAVVGGSSNAANSWLYTAFQTLSGAVASDTSDSFISPYHIYVSSDSVNTEGNNVGLSLFHVLDVCTTGFTGNRAAVFGQVNVNGVPGTNNVNAVGVVSQTVINSNMGGTSTAIANSSGIAVGGNTFVELTAPATFMLQATGLEVDVLCTYGSSMVSKTGVAIIQLAGDAVRGTFNDTGLAFVNQSGAVAKWTNGITFGAWSGLYPFDANSTLIFIQATQNPSPLSAPVGIGIDFRSGTFTTGSFMAPGFTVDPSGNVSGNTFIATGASPIASKSGLYAVASSIGFFAAGVAVGSWNGSALQFNNAQNAANTFYCLNQSAGTAASAGLLLGNSNAVGQARIVLNGGSFSGGQGANALYIQNTSTAPIVIGTGTEVIKFGGTGAFSTNGAVATTMTSLGPTGSHTTIQTWLTITDSTGTVRYIPCY